MTVRRIEPEALTQTDHYDRSAAPVAYVDPGNTLVIRTLDAWGHLEPQTQPGESRPLMFPAKRGHCLVGPIAVRGARPGQILSVRFDDLRPDTWGFTVAGGRDNPLQQHLGTASLDPAFLLWDIDADAGVASNQYGHRVAIHPFLGVTGLAPSEPGEHSTIPPRPRGGGNLDCQELVAGSTLYLPVRVDDALLYVGDGHAAQGDGEVGGTAIETGMTTTLTVELLDTAPVPGIYAETRDARITFGFSADLNQATYTALDAMITWMQALMALERAAALALASTVVDLRVTQVANDTWGVHAVLSREALLDGATR